jgi:hypothetical protein
MALIGVINEVRLTICASGIQNSETWFGEVDWCLDELVAVACFKYFVLSCHTQEFLLVGAEIDFLGGFHVFVLR